MKISMKIFIRIFMKIFYMKIFILKIFVKIFMKIFKKILPYGWSLATHFVPSAKGFTAPKSPLVSITAVLVGKATLGSLLYRIRVNRREVSTLETLRAAKLAGG